MVHEPVSAFVLNKHIGVAFVILRTVGLDDEHHGQGFISSNLTRWYSQQLQFAIIIVCFVVPVVAGAAAAKGPVSSSVRRR